MVQPHERQHEEMRAEIDALRSSLNSTRAEVRRMESCIREFQGLYEPTLKSMKEAAEVRKQQRRELMMHAIKGSMYALAAIIGTIFALGARSWLKGWLG